MKIVITGALGHIGSRVLRELYKNFSDCEIVLIDNMLTQRYCSLFNLPSSAHYRFFELDVLIADLRLMFEGADVVLHLAAITDAASSFENKEQVEHVNYNATRAVAEACQEVGCPMIHLSSTSVYGTQQKVVDEDCLDQELQPQSPYAETKLREEQFLKILSESAGLRFVTCRFGTICGISPGMRFHTAVNKFCWQAMKGEPLSVWRTALHQKRPYLTLEDAVSAIVFIIQKDLFNGQIYNVLTENLTVNILVELIQEQVPQAKIEYVDAAIMNQLSYEVSSMRFQQEGFKFTGSIKRCVYETVQLLRQSGEVCV